MSGTGIQKYIYMIAAWSDLYGEDQNPERKNGHGRPDRNQLEEDCPAPLKSEESGESGESSCELASLTSLASGSLRVVRPRE